MKRSLTWRNTYCAEYRDLSLLTRQFAPPVILAVGRYGERSCRAPDSEPPQMRKPPLHGQPFQPLRRLWKAKIESLYKASTLQANFETLVQIVGRAGQTVGQYSKIGLPFAYKPPFWREIASHLQLAEHQIGRPSGKDRPEMELLALVAYPFAEVSRSPVVSCGTVLPADGQTDRRIGISS